MSRDMFKIGNKLPIENGSITILDIILSGTDEVMYKVHYFEQFFWGDGHLEWGWSVEDTYSDPPTSEERIMTEEEIKQMIVNPK